MAVYNINGTSITEVYDATPSLLAHAYDIMGNDLLNGEEPWVKTTLEYDTNWFITSAWLENATIQRDAIKTLYQQSSDAIPFFLQTDGHGRYNEGNKGCHNLAEETMQYIANMQLGDYGSYYSDGENAAKHVQSSNGIKHYLPAIGNHELLSNNSGATMIADLPTLIGSFTPPGATLGSQTYGYYKVLDNKYHVKYLVGQPHIPVDWSIDSSGFIDKFTSDQWQWFIDEMEANDGYDIIVLNHEPFAGTYTRKSDGTTHTYSGGNFNLTPIMVARKSKSNGTFTDPDGVTHTYDFSNCQSDLLCAFHGHIHHEDYIDNMQLGYPVFIGRDMTNNGDCVYGLIDRANSKLYIYSFGKANVDEPLILNL